MKASERVKFIRKILKLSQQKFADDLEISKSYVNSVEAGRAEPSFRFVKALAEVKNININWVITGSGNIFLSEGENDDQKINEVESAEDKKSNENNAQGHLEHLQLIAQLKDSLHKTERQVESAFKELESVVGLIEAKEQDLSREMR